LQLEKAAPLYLSEVAPPKWRGALSTSFPFFLGVGIIFAGCINYGTAKHTWGWRLSLGLAVVPGAVITIGAFLITDTPNSLVERGKIEQAKKALHKIRGSSIDIQPELEELIKSTKIAKSVQQETFKTILKREYRPHLVMAFAIPFFQQVTGINVVTFYSPNLFRSLGLGHNAALLSAILLGVVKLASILISSSVIDRFGRRFLFVTGGIIMSICLVSNH
jgi:MFS transporter, SP family, sugar:H+ symporter